MTILVIAEHDNNELKPATLHAVSAACDIAATHGAEIQLLVAGYQCTAVSETASTISGIHQVICADQPEYAQQLAENISKLIVALASDYSHIIAAATSQAKSTLPQVAALLDVTQISDINQVISADTYQRPIYAGNALATVQSNEKTQVITVRTTGFPAAQNDGQANISSTDLCFSTNKIRFIENRLSHSERPELTSARIVISGGRGMGSKENFALLDPLADKLGAAIGASRAAVDAGYVPNDMQVGQTGKIVAPELYIAVGISGAIQHLAGMKDSKTIVAINTDEEAPIFSVADYGLVADLFEVVSELTSELK
ncbi:electron transfer flavoprotein subunit alpha/FixB family protein [Aliamphritea ceti]|uniref:electron transfer flavoprotein subunit alpha/FixB family protein n=1 Tax=Aliamphritea ceti TaxID=1524258 RepID=UPI0021C2D9DD|nr:FAD-binding protein [Aliamphritea ceti]